MNLPSDDKLARLRDLIDSGQMVSAIKFYRDETGVGLKEAKEAVEAMVEAKYSIAPNPSAASSSPSITGVVLSDDQFAELHERLSLGLTIQAIKLYRDFTGAGLIEAKQAIEAMEESMRSGAPISFPVNTAPPPANPASPDDQLVQIHGMIYAGQKIQAIELYREASGVGLKEAKDAVELMEANLRREQPHRFQTVQGKGCGAGMLLFCLCLGSVLCWAIGG